MGPLRVWHLNENIPGLAMSRSFGDGAAAEVGVIADPEILEMNLTEADKFIVIASDGVWEFLTNEEVVNIVMPHYLFVRRHSPVSKAKVYLTWHAVGVHA